VPPLRDRTEDIPLLAEHFLRFFCARQGRVGLSFSGQSIAVMASYPWPGNLRELRNSIERAVILSPAALIEPGDLGLASMHVGMSDVAVGGLVSIDLLEREHIARVIAKSPTLEVAARVLGIDATTLSRKRKKYQLS
jgi:two-component system, NtrC family, response regulator AlgB